ncbi:peptidylprolyl isomerase [Enterococcus lemanii]|uniref:Foldase protein PrsA n=1 Tax=Enterococcus lemanii TaxID=1159752 RepID=A0ABV9MVR4_9ENTE|nr:peptidylprolyl isomerase [Enterococcus lemanii]MBM7709411.1 foldase protein PrsA [Enterococcus lemanii]
MNKKKIILALATSMSVLALAACSNDQKNTDIATMKGATITALDFYDNARTQQSSQQIVFDMILSKVFNKAYGDKITDKDVEAELKNLFGDDLDTVLQQNNLTKKEANAIIRDRLAYQAGLKAHVELTDADLKAAWEAFHPEVEAQVIMVASQEDADSLLEKAKADDANFGELAKENSLHASKDEDGTVKFDSLSTEIPAAVQQAAFALKDGEVSDVITVQSGYSNAFYIVKMVKNQDKGNDMSKYQEQVEEIATNTILSDQNFVNKVIGLELKAANVKIKDDAFASLLTTYIEAADQGASSETEETKDSSEAKNTTETTEDTAATQETTTDDSSSK